MKLGSRMLVVAGLTIAGMAASAPAGAADLRRSTSA